VNKIVNSVFGDPNTAAHSYVVSGTEKFLPLNIDKIRRDLGVDEAASLRGRQNLPLSDDDALDDMQRAIINDIEGRHKAATNGYTAEMKLYQGRFGTLSFLTNATEIIQAARNAEGSFAKLVIDAVMDLTRLRGERNDAERDLLSFREKNRLSHDASLPKWHPLLSYSLLFLILILETALNGHFFGERVAGGVVQGVAEAFLFAFANVFCGFVLGRVATRLTSINVSLKTMAGIALLVLSAAITVNNLFAAHYRNILVGDIEMLDAAALAWSSMKADVLGIHDIKSWQLFGLGFVAAAFAGIKGWYMDEPYPGYGDKTRFYKGRVDEFIAAKKYHLDQVTAEYDKAADTIRSNVKLLEGGLAHYRALVESRKAFHKDYVAYLDHLEKSANDLLTAYRQKNRETRSDGAAPQYFKTKYALPREALAEPSTEDEFLASASDVVKTTTQKLNDQLEGLHQARLKTMNDMNGIA
jgi:hypothetical protein